MTVSSARHAVPDVTNVRVPDLVSLVGRCAVVTGGGHGIGAAIARRLAEAGAAVAVGDVDDGAARSVVDTLVADWGVAGLAGALDVRKSASVDAFADRCVAVLGGLDVWVNCAGVWPAAAVLDATEDIWDDVMDVNLKGSWLGARAFAHRALPRGPDDPQGVLVNIEAMAAHRGRSGAAHYVASKHGLVGLTRALATELGPQGIRVLGVAPTLTETEGVRRQRDGGGDRSGSSSAEDGDAIDLRRPHQVAERVGRRSLLGRTAVPDDVARVVLFCVSDLASLMTGSSLMVDAGALVE